MLYSLTQSETWEQFSAIHSVQAWSENRPYGGWMVLSVQTDSPKQTLDELRVGSRIQHLTGDIGIVDNNI